MSARRRPPRPRPHGEPVVVLGTELGTQTLYALRHAAFQRGVHVMGAIGAGKTSLLRRYLLATGFQRPWVLHDFIGTGHRHMETCLANLGTALALAERRCPELLGLAGRVLRRFAFTSIGAPNPAVRVDLLRRRRFPDGTRETVRDVTGRALEVLFTKLNDPDAPQRVRFRRIATALLACLVAAERPITEALRVLDDPAYIAFLERELSARSFRRSDHRFLTHQLAELHHVLALRPTDPTKSWRFFEDMTESTRNSLADFAPGTLLGELFGSETLPLEDIAFGRTSFSVTTRHADDTLKSQAFQALHAMLHALFLHRQDRAGLLPLTYILDEPRWVRRNFPGILAVSRNLGVSYLLAHQSLAQWEDVGLPTMRDQLRALTNLQIAFRPTSFADAEDAVLHTKRIRPDGLVQRFLVGASSETDAISTAWRRGPGLFDAGCPSTTSATSTMSEHEALNVVGFLDQVRYAAQETLWRPRFTGTVTLDGIGTEVAFFPAPDFLATLAGVPILSLYRAWHDRYWWSRLAPRTAYDPHISFWRADPSTNAAAAERTGSAPAEAVPHAAAVERAATDHPAVAGAATARTPVPPPTFALSAGLCEMSR